MRGAGPSTANRPMRCRSLRWGGRSRRVYEVTAEAWALAWRKEDLDALAMDEAADEALEALWLVCRHHS
jgi:hypothetical protein